MFILKKLDLVDLKLCVKLVKGMGYNYYGEFVWFNDLFYIFLVCILGIIVCCIGLGVLELMLFGEKVDLFVILLEIFFEWYFFLIFNLLCVILNKLLGVFLMVVVLIGLIMVLFIENVNKF